MEDLLVKLIRKYKLRENSTQNETEKDVLSGVVSDLGRLLYSYRPSATAKLLDS